MTRKSQAGTVHLLSLANGAAVLGFRQQECQGQQEDQAETWQLQNCRTREATSLYNMACLERFHRVLRNRPAQRGRGRKRSEGEEGRKEGSRAGRMETTGNLLITHTALNVFPGTCCNTLQ